jgi:transcriptional regulator with XRE-family HTH domain
VDKGFRETKDSIMEISERFARNLVRQRQRAAVSPAELANLAGLSVAEVEAAESGSARPQVDELVRLAGSLGISIDALLDGIDWDPPGSMPGKFTISDLD